MSILQEYAEIRKEIGEEKYSHIVKFLECHPQYLLSDVYYRESVWNEFEKWETAEGLNKKYKYENVDVIAFLEEKMKSNTENYQTDFNYDKEIIKKAAQTDLPSFKNLLLWLSRKNGTHCMYEKNVFIKDTSPNITWKYFENEPEQILAFAIEITGKENGIIKGNCYELDYAEHIKDVKAYSVRAKEEILHFEDGHIETVSFPNDYFKSKNLVDKHGKIDQIAYIPEDEQKLKSALTIQAEKRKLMKSANVKNIKINLDKKIKDAELKNNKNISDKTQPDKDIEQER